MRPSDRFVSSSADRLETLYGKLIRVCLVLALYRDVDSKPISRRNFPTD